MNACVLQECLAVVGIIETALREGAGSVSVPQSQILRHKEVKLPDGQ